MADAPGRDRPWRGAAVAGRREMLEEIGSNRAELLQESRIWRSYDLPAEPRGPPWRGRYRGQTQRWLAFRFIGTTPTSTLTASTRSSAPGAGYLRMTCRS